MQAYAGKSLNFVHFAHKMSCFEDISYAFAANGDGVA